MSVTKRLFASIVALATISLIPLASYAVAYAGPHRQLSLTPVASEPRDGQTRLSSKELISLQQKVAAEPKNRKAHFAYVRALMRNRDYESALLAANAWRDKDAYNLVVVRLIGDIYAAMGNKAAALRVYSAVVELLPKDARAHRALASVLKQDGRLVAARDLLAVAKQLRPDDKRVHFELADVLHRLGEPQPAQALLEALANDAKTASRLRYPSKQRLAQVYNAQRHLAIKAKDADAEARLTTKIAALGIAGGTVNDIKVYLTWDTDRSDVDLWVKNPIGQKIYYNHRKGKFGGALYDDVTTGYGPESFTASTAQKGVYTVQVHYFSAGASNFSQARGEVVVVLGEGRRDEVRHVLPYRLFRAKQHVTVATITVK